MAEHVKKKKRKTLACWEFCYSGLLLQKRSNTLTSICLCVVSTASVVFHGRSHCNQIWMNTWGNLRWHFEHSQCRNLLQWMATRVGIFIPARSLARAHTNIHSEWNFVCNVKVQFLCFLWLSSSFFSKIIIYYYFSKILFKWVRKWPWNFTNMALYNNKPFSRIYWAKPKVGFKEVNLTLLQHTNPHTFWLSRYILMDPGQILDIFFARSCNIVLSKKEPFSQPGFICFFYGFVYSYFTLKI